MKMQGCLVFALMCSLIVFGLMAIDQRSDGEKVRTNTPAYVMTDQVPASPALIDMGPMPTQWASAAKSEKGFGIFRFSRPTPGGGLAHPRTLADLSAYSSYRDPAHVILTPPRSSTSLL